MTATDVAFIGCDAADIIRVFAHQIAIQIVQCLPHFGSVFLIDAKDDCLREAIGLVQKISEMLCNRFGSLEQSNFSFEVRRSINLVWDATPIAINIIFTRPPTRRIPLSDDAVDSIWRKKAVFNSLPQTVLVNRIAEVKVRVASFIAQRCGCHAELVGGLEVFEDLAPIRIFAGAAAVTFIDDDQIEEVRRVLFIQAGSTFILCQRLIDREINLAALNSVSVFDLRAGVAELGEDFIFGIVNQNIAVRQVENFRTAMLAGSVPARIPKLPTDLKRNRRFPGARRHREQNAAFASDDRFNRAIDRNFLVVAFPLPQREIDRR